MNQQLFGCEYMQVKDVKDQYIQKASQYIQEHYVVGDALKRSIRENILTMMKIKSWRGSR
jgi:ribosomal protein S13